MTFFLGIDGGGSKTACLLGDETSVLASATSTGSNVVRAGEAQAREALHSTITSACRSAGVAPAQIQRACLGAAGAARPEVRDILQRALRELITGEIEIVGDMEIALDTAFEGGPGVITIAGTGSIAYGCNRRGVTARAGGWGFAVSDEGSGQWIGRTAVGAALRALDEDGNSSLLERLAQCWGLSTREQMVLAANATPPPDFAGLLPAVLEACDSGDPVARTALSRAGEELARLAGIVIRKLFPAPSVVPVAMSGGVFAHSLLVREVFYNSLRAERSDVALKPEIVEPVQGALSRARRGPRQ